MLSSTPGLVRSDAVFPTAFYLLSGVAQVLSCGLGYASRFLFWRNTASLIKVLGTKSNLLVFVGETSAHVTNEYQERALTG